MLSVNFSLFGAILKILEPKISKKEIEKKEIRKNSEVEIKNF